MLAVVERQFGDGETTYRMGDVVDVTHFRNRVALESAGYVRAATLADLERIGVRFSVPLDELHSINIYDVCGSTGDVVSAVVSWERNFERARDDCENASHSPTSNGVQGDLTDDGELASWAEADEVPEAVGDEVRRSVDTTEGRTQREGEPSTSLGNANDTARSEPCTGSSPRPRRSRSNRS